jgi:transposase, IS6 family
VISTDKNPAYGEAIADLKKEGKLPRHVEHRQAKYLNNRLEADHGQLNVLEGGGIFFVKGRLRAAIQ